MGASNVKLVYAQWGHLADRPFRLLVHMALVTLDDDRDGRPARRYWQGREALAGALGRSLPSPDDTTDDARARRAAAFEAVRSALKSLVDAGAVARGDSVARSGHRAEYVLHLVIPQPQGQPAPEAQAQPVVRPRLSLPPRSSEEEPQEQHQESGPRPDAEALCRHLAQRIEENGSRRPTITARWRDAARLLIDRDKRDPQQAHQVIDWCQADEFWRSNILSMPKFREKYDQLRLASLRPPPPTERPRPGASVWNNTVRAPVIDQWRQR